MGRGRGGRGRSKDECAGLLSHILQGGLTSHWYSYTSLLHERSFSKFCVNKVKFKLAATTAFFDVRKGKKQFMPK